MTGAWGRIAAVARVEVNRLLRARLTLTLLLSVPAMQVLLFGYAIQPGGGAVAVVIAADSDVGAERVGDALAGVAGLRVSPGRLPPGGAEAAVRRGTAQVGVELPPLRALASITRPPPPLRVFVDASDPALTNAAVPRIEAAYWRARAGRGGAANAARLQIERLFNPQGRADWGFLPALVGVVVMIGSLLFGALGLAREREGGTWEALLALPIRPWEALAGKLAPYAVTGTLQGLLVLAVGHALFGVPYTGSPALVLLLPLFAAAHVALGHAIAGRAATQIEALQGAVAFYLPAMLLSGFLYPFETLPRWARILGELFPLTHFVRAARGATLRGDGAAAVLAHALPIAAFLAVAVALALAAARRRID